MSEPMFPPRIHRGALIGVQENKTVTRVVRFQYNPEKLTRTVTPQFGPEGGSPAEVLRLRGAPKETIALDVEIDANDQLPPPTEGGAGIHPQLAALELLVYPACQYVKDTFRQLDQGTMEIFPPLAPIVLFVWGPRRVLPTRLTAFTIHEEAFDVELNPINAKVSLTLQVLTYNDLPSDHPGFEMFLSYQAQKENLARGPNQDLSAALSAVNRPME